MIAGRKTEGLVRARIMLLSVIIIEIKVLQPFFKDLLGWNLPEDVSDEENDE